MDFGTNSYLKICFLVASFVYLLCCGISEGRNTPLRLRIQSELNTGNCKRIAEFCREQVCQYLERGKLDDEIIAQALSNEDIILAAHVGRYFSLPEVRKSAICNALIDKEFVEWILARPAIFEDLAFSNNGSDRTLKLFHSIWLKENKRLEGPMLNLALGAALNVRGYTDEELLAKFDYYKQAHIAGRLFSQFETLKPWEMSIVLQTINSIGQVEDFEWALNYLDGKKRITANNIGQTACGLIPYRSKNKNGVSVHAGGAFYDNKPITLKLYTEYGGVCGAVSKGASGFCRSKGVPAYPIGQPGHCAFIWKKPGNNWVIGNNVCGGWNWSEGNGSVPWKGPTAVIQVLDHYFGIGKTVESSNAYYFAELVQNPANGDKLIEYALTQNRKNYPAWQARLNRLGRRNIPPDVFFEMARELNAAFAEEPAILEHLIKKNLIPKMKATDKFRILAFMLNPVETGDSQDIYLRNLWSHALKDIPELQEMKIQYDHKTSRSLLSNWEKYYDENKIKTRTKAQTCVFLQKTIVSLKERKETRARMVSFYLKLLTNWKDAQFMSQADEFIKRSLKESKDPAVLREMLDLGLKLGDFQKNKGMIKRYLDGLEKLKNQ